MQPTGTRTRRTLTPAGVIGTILLAFVVLACIRLGVWQLDRLEQRRTANARIESRLAAPIIYSGDVLADTTAALFRTARLDGSWDVARSIVLPGRALRGVPGVHVMTPFRLAPDRAVLVNRGWVPSPDGATVALDSLPVTGHSIEGLVLPFPGRAASLAPPRRLATDSFRVVWYAIDGDALRRQFPYTLEPVTIQLLPSADATGYPRRLDRPLLDEGPHLSYAFQWFSFALIGIIGWVALLWHSRKAAAAATALVLLLAPGTGRAQLRPLDPFDWHVYDPAVHVVGSLGGAVLLDQPATVAAAYGDLIEIGNYRLLWRTGRVVIDLSGTAFWRFHEDSIRGAPLPDVDPAADGVRADPGPALAATVVRLSPDRWNTDVVLRFGTRIPTTSDESGLERDRTDFFALLGARWRLGAWSLTGESGVGINGAKREEYPQSDVWIYTAGAHYRHRGVAAFAQLLGHQDGHSWRVQGNEDQAELRVGARVGRRWWLQAQYVHGVLGVAPARGLMLSGGFALGCRSECLPFN